MGTTFGGSIYGAVDPIYMVMLRRRLGDDFTVWDKAATIRFRRPGESTLFADFEVDDHEVRTIRSSLDVDESPTASTISSWSTPRAGSTPRSRRPSTSGGTREQAAGSTAGHESTRLR